MADSSDDDLPLGARHNIHEVIQGIDSDSDKGSPVPDWISQHTTPARPQLREDTADSHEEDLVDLVFQEPQLQATERGAKHKPQGLANSMGKQPTGTEKKTPSAKKITAPTLIKGAAAVLPPAGASQPVAIAAIPEAAAAGEVPIMIPEKLAKGRWLVELDPSDNGATDLTGDAGAVGRFSVVGTSMGPQELLLDLKGVIYSATLSRAASTLCVVSLVNQNEARVEALMDCYISLREESAPGGAIPGPGTNNDFFMFDDDDLYQADQPGEDHAAKAGKRKAKTEADDAPKPKRKAGGPGATKGATVSKRKASAKKPAKVGGTKGGKKKK